jgi:nucleotide-binding universal stress UspA family protein
MGFPFKRILCPIEFDDAAQEVLKTAAQIAQRSDDATVIVLHVLPFVMPPPYAPVRVDISEPREAARGPLREMASRALDGIRYEISTHIGNVPVTIMRAQQQFGADLIVIATRGRRGLAHAFLGSVAEKVLRESNCPVLVVRISRRELDVVGQWMNRNPPTASPEEKLSSVQAKMDASELTPIPVVDRGKLVGTISARDLRQHAGYVEVRLVMTPETATVTPATPIREAARLLCERQIRAMPVTEGDKLIGMITSSDLLNAVAELD